MPTDNFRLDGRVALVTGASQGIGRAIARALAGAGATVVVSDLAAKTPAVDSVCREIAAAGGKASGCELDVTDTARLPAVFDRLIDAHGRLDILVNNAGVVARKPALDITEADWDRVLGINLRGLFFCAQTAARHMAAHGGGRIINIASQRVLSAAPNSAPYTASKAGVAGLTRALALEWFAHGITVNAVGPGPVDTPLAADAGPEMEREIAFRSPTGARLQPDDIVGAVVFLASPAASAVNGHLLLVDAGWTAA